MRHVGPMDRSVLFLAALLSARIKEPVFDKFHNHRPGQVCHKFHGCERNAGFHELFVFPTPTLCIDIDFFLPHGR